MQPNRYKRRPIPNAKVVCDCSYLKYIRLQADPTSVHLILPFCRVNGAAQSAQAESGGAGHRGNSDQVQLHRPRPLPVHPEQYRRVLEQQLAQTRAAARRQAAGRAVQQ